MCESLVDPPGLKFLWKRRGNKNYDLKSFIYDGAFIQYMVFEDKRKCQTVLGKIVASPGEGEAYHWPRLQHENLIPLLDVVSINETKSVYIFPFIGKSIRNVIHDRSFLYDSECFNRKKAYAEDILWALDYLHGKSLCLMNLTDLIIYICNVSDKAVLCDFSCVFLIGRATKDKIRLPTLYQAPEVNTEDFEPIAGETWALGVMLLQIFTRHNLPSAFVGNEVYQVIQAVREINYDLIKEANPGCQLNVSDIEKLREFLDLFLVQNPKKRINVQHAAFSSFLRCSRQTKINDDNFNKQLMEIRANTAHQNSNKFKNSAIFKDIYLEEVTKYRNKLKQVPYTNKFINLEFIPECDNTRKLHENQQYLNRKLSKINRIAETVSKDVQLSSDTDLEESVIVDEAVTSELFENDSSMEFLHEIDSSRLGENPNTFEDVTGGSPVQIIDEYLHNNYLVGHKISEISVTSYDSVIKDILDEYERKELFESKSNFSLQTDDISIDSLECLENAAINLNTSNKPNELDLNFQKNRILPCNKLKQKENKKFISHPDRTYFRQTIQTKPDSRKSDSNLRNNRAIHKMNLIPSKSESYIANIPRAKYKSDDFDFSGSIFFSAQSNSKNSKQIMLLDSANLNKMSNDDVSGYSWLSYRGINQPIKKTLLVTQAKTADIYNKCTASQLTMNDCSQNMDKQLSNENGNKLAKPKDSAKSLKLCNRGDKNLEEDNVTIVNSIKDNEVTLTTTHYNQCEEKVNCLHCKNSYRQAMSQELSNVTISKPVNCRNNLFSKLKKMRTAPFKNLIINNKLSSKKQSNCSCLPTTNDYNYQREDEFAVEKNPSTIGPTSLDIDASLLNNKTSKHRKKGKKPQKMRNKWIQHLCPGSRTN